ncbi:hypothetical protein [Desulfocastanea catecholica]
MSKRQSDEDLGIDLTGWEKDFDVIKFFVFDVAPDKFFDTIFKTASKKAKA